MDCRDQDNDGRFPDESLVEVRYPHSKQEDRDDRGEVAVADGFDAASMAGRPPAVPAQAGIATCRA